VLLNPAAENALGIDAATALGEHVDSLGIASGILALLGQPLGAGQMLSSEVALPTGQIVSCRVSTICSASGEELGRVATLRDITVLRSLETSKTQFVNRVSQDLRRPLTLIRGYATMLPTVGPLNARQQQFVSNIADGVEDMGRLVRGLIGLGAVDTEVGAERRPIHLATMVADVVGRARAVAEEHGVFLRMGSLDPSAVTVGDAARLRQSVASLVERAICGVAPGDPVRIGVDSSLGYAIVRVSATLVREPPSSARIEQPAAGTGIARPGPAPGSAGDLELAAVRSILEKHGGSLHVEVDAAGQTVFVLRLPSADGGVQRP
jgi:two-component system phosphate regulon sensor histidine kinase PhoR